MQHHQKIKRTVFDYNCENFDELRATLEMVGLYGTVKSAVDINHGWLNWKEQFLSAVCGSIPRKTISNVNNPPWINGEIIHTIRKKETVRWKLKTTPTDILKNKFKALRSKVKRMITESRGQFFENISEALSNNPKRFWSVFKISSKRSSVPGIMTMGSNALDSKSVRSASCTRDRSVQRLLLHHCVRKRQHNSVKSCLQLENNNIFIEFHSHTLT